MSFLDTVMEEESDSSPDTTSSQQREDDDHEDVYAADEETFSMLDDAQPIPGLQPIADGESRDRVLLDRVWQKYFQDKQPGQVAWDGVPNITDVFRIFGLDENQPPDPVVVNDKIKELTSEASAVLAEMDRGGLREREHMAEFMIRVIFAKLDASHHLFTAIVKLHNADSMQPADFGDHNRGLWRFVPMKPTEPMNAGQRMRVFALNDLSQRGFRRYREDIMRPVMARSAAGAARTTCAWERVFSIHDYVKSLSGRRNDRYSPKEPPPALRHVGGTAVDAWPAACVIGAVGTPIGGTRPS